MRKVAQAAMSGLGYYEANTTTRLTLCTTQSPPLFIQYDRTSLGQEIRQDTACTRQMAGLGQNRPQSAPYARFLCANLPLKHQRQMYRLFTTKLD